MPTFEDWFNGRFWREWVIGNQNKPSEVEAKRSIYDTHLGPAFGKHAAGRDRRRARSREFRAKLVTSKNKRTKTKLSRKRINNILAVLSKSLRYAADVGLISYGAADRAVQGRAARDRVLGLRGVRAHSRRRRRREGREWYAAACLAGEAGLRVGEIRALQWREHVDLIAGTHHRQRADAPRRDGHAEGWTRRVVPMTLDAARGAEVALDVVRTGFVVRNADGDADDRRADDARDPAHLPDARACPSAAGTRCGTPSGRTQRCLGVNPWRLQAWMGHDRIDETMLYVHVAADRHRAAAARASCRLVPGRSGSADPASARAACVREVERCHAWHRARYPWHPGGTRSERVVGAEMKKPQASGA